MPEGCPEKLDLEFMKYIWDFPKGSGKRNLEKLKIAKDKKIIVFSKGNDANKFIEELKVD